MTLSILLLRDMFTFFHWIFHLLLWHLISFLNDLSSLDLLLLKEERSLFCFSIGAFQTTEQCLAYNSFLSMYIVEQISEPMNAYISLFYTSLVRRWMRGLLILNHKNIYQILVYLYSSLLQQITHHKLDDFKQGKRILSPVLRPEIQSRCLDPCSFQGPREGFTLWIKI